MNDYEENEYDPWDDDGSGELGAGDYEEEEGLGADLGFDDDDDDDYDSKDSGELGEEEWEEEDFGDYYDDGNEDTEFFDFYEDRDDGVADPQDEDDPEDVWGFEDGDEAFTSFCESATSDLIKEDVAGNVCDILVTGLDENIAKTHLHVDGVYKPIECLNGYLKYVPAEGEDARMIAFDVDFEEWGFYNGSEVAQESLILHGSQFSARVPQEVEAWYCDWKVCETDTENEHFWTPITTAQIACIAPEEEEKRVRMMGKRKNEIIFPDEEARTKNKPQKIDTSENWRDSSAGGGGAYEYSAVDSAMLSIVVMIAGSIVIGIPLYIYLKQSGASQAALSLRAHLRQVRTGGLPSSARSQRSDSQSKAPLEHQNQNKPCTTKTNALIVKSAKQRAREWWKFINAWW